MLYLWENKWMRKFTVELLLLVLLASCAPAVAMPQNTPPPSPSPAPSATPTSMSEALWVDPAAPAQLVDLSQTWGISLTEDPSLATHKLELSELPALCGFMPSLRLSLR